MSNIERDDSKMKKKEIDFSLPITIRPKRHNLKFLIIIKLGRHQPETQAWMRAKA